MRNELAYLLKTLWGIGLFLFFHVAVSQNVVFSNSKELLDISPSISILEDVDGDLPFNSVVNGKFTSTGQAVSNLGKSGSTFWVKIQLTNTTIQEHLVLELAIPTIDLVVLYSESGNELVKMGEQYPFNNRVYNAPNFYFDLYVPQNLSKTYYMKVANTDVIQLPLQLGMPSIIQERINNNILFLGLYAGLMLMAILYNLFVYFSVKDKSYIYYVTYILLVLLTQTTLQGHTFQFLWPNFPQLAMMSNFLLPALVGIAGLEFMRVFLKVKEYNQRISRVSFLFIGAYIVGMALAFFNQFSLSLKMIEITAILVSFYMLGVSIYIAKKGYQPAKYFTAAWSVFLLGVIAYVLKDVGVFPYNNFTRYTMQIGSGIETILLSFALAARINVYKKERLEAVKEKEQLLREQNVILEQKVEHRTKELNRTLTKLKDAQVQLVDAEKMSSLGQLTAGIAHEINNPINFVSSNISPLRQDIADLEKLMAKYEELSPENAAEKLQEIEQIKQEIDYSYLKTELISIVDGIEDGARRTSEIVSGLRNFSRLDEGDLKLADINLGIMSTLVLIKNKLGDIKVEIKGDEHAEIECNAGKINQVIMNLLDNAIDAIKEKHERTTNGIITIETKNLEDAVQLIISDNGNGIPEHILKNIFDPFFTTKDIGAGTGLGLSIVKGILDNHHATYHITSTPKEGTIFKITLPKMKMDGKN